jgi:hypothetical protein
LVIALDLVSSFASAFRSSPDRRGWCLGAIRL